MKYITKGIKVSFLLVFSAMLILSSCNKAPEQIYGPAYVPPTGNTLGVTLAAIANDSLYYKLIIRGGMLATINSLPNTYTMFVPDNNAMRVFINFISGGLVPIAAPDPVFVGFINTNIPAASAAGIVSYNICPQALPISSIPSTFPNFQYPSILNPAPALSALLRLTTFPSTRNGNWVNNVPMTTAVNVSAANGIIHHTAGVVVPPSRFLWDRINTDPDLTLLKAAVQRADSGVAASNPSSLIGALQNIGANLTVFAPSNQAFKNLISALTGGAIPPGAPDFVFIGFIGSNNVTTQTIKGIVVYHIMGVRAFSNNLPITATSYRTLLNGGIPTHPGVSLKSTFTGMVVTAMTAKGVANATASNIALNPTPDPFGTSDQHFLNGTLHKIDQVMLPQ